MVLFETGRFCAVSVTLIRQEDLHPGSKSKKIAAAIKEVDTNFRLVVRGGGLIVNKLDSPFVVSKISKSDFSAA